jgi:hypothetical protein
MCRAKKNPKYCYFGLKSTLEAEETAVVDSKCFGTNDEQSLME